MRIAVVSADPLLGEALSSLLFNTCRLNVVCCLSSLSSVELAMSAQHPELVVVTDDFTDESNLRVLRNLRVSHGLLSVLLHSRPFNEDPSDRTFDATVSHWQGVGAVCRAIRTISDSESPLGKRAGRTTRTSSSVADPGVPEESGHSFTLGGAHGRWPLGEPPRLTPRLRETVELLAVGKSNQEICDILGIKLPTAKIHVGKVLKIYGCTNRLELALKLRDIGEAVSTG